MTVQDVVDVYTQWVSRWPDKHETIDRLIHELTVNRKLALNTELVDERDITQMKFGLRQVIWPIVQNDAVYKIADTLISKANALSLGVDNDQLDILDI